MNTGKSQKRIFIDRDKCIGCLNCSVACMNAHSEDNDDVYLLNLSNPKNESRNFIRQDSHGKYAPLFCRHCDEPECVVTCMSGALTKNPETGLVLYNREICGSCFMCVMNCPYGNVKPDRLTRTYVLKCDFCMSKPNRTGPSCIEACPTKAIYLKDVNEA